MKIAIWVASASVIGFVVGFGVHQLTSKVDTVPAPSIAVLNEFTPMPGAAPLRVALRPEDVARLNQEMSGIQRDSASFRTELDKMEHEYRQRVEAVLDPEQRKRLHHAGEAAHVTGTPPTSEIPSTGSEDVLIAAPPPGQSALTPSIPGLPPETLHSILELTFVTWSLENMRTELALKPDQVNQLREILTERRTRFLELADRFPPPTLRLLNVGRELGKSVIRATPVP